MIIYFHKSVIININRYNNYLSKDGISLFKLREIAEKEGFTTFPVQINIDTLIQFVPLPCIAFWQNNHFVVVYAAEKDHLVIADPAIGLVNYSIQEFTSKWLIDSKSIGSVLLLEF